MHTEKREDRVQVICTV